MGRHGRGAVALGGVVATGVEDHAALARQMRLRLRDFAGDEGLRPSGDGGFEVALRPAAAPSYIFNSCLRLPYLRDRPIQYMLQMMRQRLRKSLSPASLASDRIAFDDPTT